MRFTFSDILHTYLLRLKEETMGRYGHVLDFGSGLPNGENYQGHDYDNVTYQHSGGRYILSIHTRYFFLTLHTMPFFS